MFLISLPRSECVSRDVKRFEGILKGVKGLKVFEN